MGLGWVTVGLRGRRGKSDTNNPQPQRKPGEREGGNSPLPAIPQLHRTLGEQGVESWETVHDEQSKINSPQVQKAPESRVAHWVWVWEVKQCTSNSPLSVPSMGVGRGVGG